MDFETIFPNVTDSFGHWLAGFVDGEGSFTVHNSQKQWIIQFQIGLRADDINILHEIKSTLNIGSVSNVNKNFRTKGDGKRINAHPKAVYTVSTRGTQRLVLFFERYPLRSKKQRDFEAWKLAVKEYSKSYYHPGKLKYYMEILKAGRVYNSDEQIIEELPDMQLAFAL